MRVADEELKRALDDVGAYASTMEASKRSLETATRAVKSAARGRDGKTNRHLECTSTRSSRCITPHTPSRARDARTTSGNRPSPCSHRV